MRTRLTQKQETFCLKYFELGNASEAAKIAGYSPKAIRQLASENLTKPNIKARIDQLRQKAEDESISTVKERAKILTKIQRTTVGDFVDEHGNLDVKKDQLYNPAIRYITTERNKSGGLRTMLGLRDPVTAISEHNKMDRVYEEKPSYQDNRQYNIIVADNQTKEELRLLIAGNTRETPRD